MPCEPTPDPGTVLARSRRLHDCVRDAVARHLDAVRREFCARLSAEAAGRLSGRPGGAAERCEPCHPDRLHARARACAAAARAAGAGPDRSAGRPHAAPRRSGATAIRGCGAAAAKALAGDRSGEGPGPRQRQDWRRRHLDRRPAARHDHQQLCHSQPAFADRGDAGRHLLSAARLARHDCPDRRLSAKDRADHDPGAVCHYRRDPRRFYPRPGDRLSDARRLLRDRPLSRRPRFGGGARRITIRDLERGPYRSRHLSVRPDSRGQHSDPEARRRPHPPPSGMGDLCAAGRRRAVRHTGRAGLGAGGGGARRARPLRPRPLLPQHALRRMRARSSAADGALRMNQLTIAFPCRTALGRADFLISSGNEEAVAWLDRWPLWPAGTLVLHGPPGCGKTHLVHLWCERTGGAAIAGNRLDERALAAVIEAGPAGVAVDDADGADERALLHLYNWCRERCLSLLLTAGQPPGLWAIALGDLRSRLRAAVAVGIALPDDALLGAVLVKHFADRQLRVTPEVIAYLVSRLERSFAAAADIAARLDAAALASGRAVTIPLARRILAERQHSSPSEPGVT